MHKVNTLDPAIDIEFHLEFGNHEARFYDDGPTFGFTTVFTPGIRIIIMQCPYSIRRNQLVPLMRSHICIAIRAFQFAVSGQIEHRTPLRMGRAIEATFFLGCLINDCLDPRADSHASNPSE